MIRISLGNVGSGKTANEVREMMINRTRRKTYSNIITRNIPNNITLKPGMILQKNIVGSKKKRDGTEEPIYELKVNQEFWQKVEKPVNVVLDEAHSILNARRPGSAVNVKVNDWIALIRRVLGASEAGYGEFVMISQLSRRIDVIAREMANQVRWHTMHYMKTCRKCGYTWKETSDMPEPAWTCRRCGHYGIRKFNHRIEIRFFASMAHYEAWNMMGAQSFYNHIMVNDIEKAFKNYDTYQWDNLFSEFY